ncbi:MAG: methyltransferase domain-containing protein [Pleurocapsa sp. MO_226.B13]|nr:methyltransferase domain-containing protein [Pleurocapsa sp. MO_226.B13]
MHWKLKAAIQNSISLLPSSASYAAYYWIQKRFGGLKSFNPMSRLSAGVETWRYILQQGHEPSGKTFLEVGTGRVPFVPLAYWLMGAKKTITIDLNPYMKSELIVDSLDRIKKNREEILNFFGSLIDRKRFNRLLEFCDHSQPTEEEFLDLCQIDYIAPGDAANTPLPDCSIDYHTSYAVFEHIPQEVLKEILEEGNRITKNNGLFVHRIDYSDHFSHSDKSISAINFLQYSDAEWKRYAGNRYMYTNRLRHDDFVNLFVSVGHEVIESKFNILEQRMRERVKSGDFTLDKKFSSKPEEILAIIGAWIITQKKKESAKK